MDEETKAGIGIALDEAILLGAEVRREHRRGAITFAVLSLPDDGGPVPSDRRVSLVLEPVGRVVASLRGGRWNDPTIPAIPLALESLLETVQSFQRLAVYGTDFIDCDTGFAAWSNRLSLDERLGEDGHSHSITLFQSGPDTHLDFRIWFDTLRIFRPDRSEIPLQDFIAAGKRWWDAFNVGDSRTEGFGIFPVK